MRRDLNAILEYVAQLGELDTAGVEPLAQVSDLLDSVVDSGDGAGLRIDALRPSLDRALVMEEAPRRMGLFSRLLKSSSVDGLVDLWNPTLGTTNKPGCPPSARRFCLPRVGFHKSTSHQRSMTLES